MKFILAVIFFFAVTARADNDLLKLQIHELIQQQQAQIDETLTKLASMTKVADDLGTELTTAERQVNTVAKERDDFRVYGDAQHELLTKARVATAKKDLAILRLWVTIGLMGAAIAGYIVAHYVYHVIP